MENIQMINSFIEPDLQYEPSYYAGCIIAFDKENINCLSILLLSKEK